MVRVSTTSLGTGRNWDNLNFPFCHPGASELMTWTCPMLWLIWYVDSACVFNSREKKGGNCLPVVSVSLLCARHNQLFILLLFHCFMFYAFFLKSRETVVTISLYDFFSFLAVIGTIHLFNVPVLADGWGEDEGETYVWKTLAGTIMVEEEDQGWDGTTLWTWKDWCQEFKITAEDKQNRDR